MIKRFFVSILLFSAGIFTFSLVAAPRVYAGTCTWTGDSSINWNDSGNWTGDCSGAGIPDDGDTLVFPDGLSNYLVENNISGLEINGIEIISSEYEMSGNTITFQGTIDTNGFKPTLTLDFQLSGPSTFQTGEYAGDINLNTNTLTITSNSDASDLSGIISGEGNVIVNNGNYLSNFSGANTFEGEVSIGENATFQALHPSALGNLGNTVTVMTGGYFAIGNSTAISHALTLQTGGNIVSYGENNVMEGNITGASDGYLTFFPSLENFTVTGVISADFVILGSDGEMTLNGSTSNDIDVFHVQAGTLRLANTSGNAINGDIVVGQSGSIFEAVLYSEANNQIADTSDVRIETGSRWDLQGYDDVVHDILLHQASIIGASSELHLNELFTESSTFFLSSGIITLQGGVIEATDGEANTTSSISASLINLSQATTVTETGGVLTFSGALTGSNDLTLLGEHITLSGDSSGFSGDIYIGNEENNSVIGIYLYNTSLGNTVGKTIIANGSTLFLNATGTVAEDIDVSGQGYGTWDTRDYSAIHGLFGTDNELTGTITLLGNTRFGVENDAQVEFSTTITGAYGVNFVGGGDTEYGIILSGTNDYTGSSSLSNAKLTLTSSTNDALNHATEFIMSGTSVLDIAAGETMGAISGTGSIIIAAGQNLILPYVFGDKTFSGSISGDGNILKYGTSNITLTGASADFTGDIVASEGPVTINNNFENATLRAQGGTIKGSGTTGNLIIESGGVAPGNSPGILTVKGDFSIDDDGTYFVELNGTTVGTGYDQLNVTGSGNITLTNSILNITASSAPQDGRIYTILKTTGSITGEFVGIPNYSTVEVAGKDMYIFYDENKITLMSPATLYLTKFKATPSSITVGDTVTLEVQWSGSGVTPTGITRFKEGSKTLGTKTLSGGKATLQLSGLSVGTHTYTVTFEGDGIYMPAISGPIEVTVTAAPEVEEETSEELTTPIPTPTPVYQLSVAVADKDNKPVPNAEVTLTPGNLTGDTNDFGRFDFLGLPPGQYSITVKANGIETTQSVNLTDNSDVKVTLTEEDSGTKDKKDSNTGLIFGGILVVGLILFISTGFFSKKLPRLH